MLGTYLKYVFITALITGLFLSFHNTLYPWAYIAVAIVWGMIITGLALERREREKEKI